MFFNLTTNGSRAKLNPELAALYTSIEVYAIKND
jgi:hypothetical protein